MEKHLFQSLRQQLAFEIFFVKNVSRTYRDTQKNVEIVDFEYKGMPYKLILNGKITLEANDRKMTINSYHDLVHGLIQSNYPQRKMAS